MPPLLFFWLATVYVNVCTKNYVWTLHCGSWRLYDILPARPILMFIRLLRLTGQMLKRGHYNDGIWWSNFNRTQIQGRSVIVMLLSQVFWRSGACFCLLSTRQLSLWASSPFGDIVKSRRARGTEEGTRKLCCLRADVSYFLCCACNKGNRRRLHAGKSFAVRSRVLARLASLAQTGEIARRLRTARINLSFYL